MDMLYDVVRPCLSVMLGWKIGAENDWSVSVGKSDKYMNRYLTPEIWNRYLETVPSCEYEAIKQATETMIDLGAIAKGYIADQINHRFCI